MNWTLLIIVFVIITVLLILNVYLLDQAQKKQPPQDAGCRNCRRKSIEDFMELRCKNKQSKFYGCMVDDYDCCEKWRGDLNRCKD